MNDPKRQIFRALFDQNSKRIFNLCYGYSGDRDLANDLLQETFMKVWKHLDQFRNQAQASTWIYRIAVNTCLSYLRSAKRKPTERLDDHPLEDLTEESSDKEDQIAALYRAISKLRELDRIIITMVLDEVPYPEIAEIAGVTEGNLRVKIHRIKQKLTELYNRGHETV